jgi:hypothetical protein
MHLRLVGFRIAFLSSSCLALAGCLRPAVLWIAPGSTAEELTFVLAEERDGGRPVESFEYFAVRSCWQPDRPQETFWERDGRGTGIVSAADTIRYGVTPVGLRSRGSARPLVAGCYEALASGSGVSASVAFTVDSAGTVRLLLREASRPAT